MENQECRIPVRPGEGIHWYEVDICSCVAYMADNELTIEVAYIPLATEHVPPVYRQTQISFNNCQSREMNNVLSGIKGKYHYIVIEITKVSKQVHVTCVEYGKEE